MSRTVRSPDGRTWTLERARPESVVSAAKKEPVFWGSIILTALMIGFIVWITIRIRGRDLSSSSPWWFS